MSLIAKKLYYVGSPELWIDLQMMSSQDRDTQSQNTQARGGSQLMEKSKLIELLTDLGWDYQSLTSSGRDTYDEIMRGLGLLGSNESWIDL